MTINIPVSDRQKYIKSFYDEVFGNPIRFDKSCEQHRLLRRLLKKAPENYKPEIPSENSLTISVPRFDDLNIEYNNYLSERAKRIFYQDLYDLFFISLIKYVRELEKSRVQIKDAVLEFMERTNIPEDHFDCLIKIVYRNRKKKQKTTLTPIFL